MHPTLLSTLIFCLLFVLLAAGMPIGFAMGLSAFLGTLSLIDAGAALALLGQTAYETALTYDLSVVPMFVLMGRPSPARPDERMLIGRATPGSAIAAAAGAGNHRRLRRSRRSAGRVWRPRRP
jgi:hypothetical protein